MLVRDKMGKSKTDGVYFEYLTINGVANRYHVVTLDTIGYSFLMPDNYTIIYNKSLCKYDGMGHLRFYNGQNKFDFDYFKEDDATFRYNINLILPKVKKTFTNYRNQVFYEVTKDNTEVIYLYFEGFMYRIKSYHKLSMNEYFDAYLMLLSLTSKMIHTDIPLLKEVIYFHQHALSNLIAEHDLLLENLSDVSSIDISLADINVTNDEDYMEYKDHSHKIELLEDYLLTMEDTSLGVFYEDGWQVKGTFLFGCFGRYSTIHINGYQEIIDAEKLTIAEKENLLTTIIKERQMEVDSHKTRLKNELYQYIASYFIECVSYELWHKSHFKEFINVDSLLSPEEDLDDINLYAKTLNYLEDTTDLMEAASKLFNYQKICDSATGKEMVITPDTCLLKLSLCNDLFCDINISLDDNYFIKY